MEGKDGAFIERCRGISLLELGCKALDCNTTVKILVFSYMAFLD